MAPLEDPSPPPEQTVRWVLEAVGPGGRLASVRPLLGGSWHANHAIDVLDRKGRLHQLVLRRWARSGWELADPDFTAAREARILELLVETLIPAPKLLAADPAGTDCDVPALLLTRIPGHPPGRPRDMDSFLQQLASALPLIHSVGGRAQAVVPGYRRYHEPRDLRCRRGSLPPGSGSGPSTSSAAQRPRVRAVSSTATTIPGTRCGRTA